MCKQGRGYVCNSWLHKLERCKGVNNWGFWITSILNSISTVLTSHWKLTRMLVSWYLASMINRKKFNRAYLCKVLENIIFLARQGLPMRGNWVSPDDSEARWWFGAKLKFSPATAFAWKGWSCCSSYHATWMWKYTDHHIWNKFLLQILALGHLHKIVTSIRESGYFSLEADEVTDTSNKEQLVV